MKWYLGQLKDVALCRRNVYLRDFSWDCGWYWGGGYVGNADFHCHFDGCFLDVPDYRGHPLGRFAPRDLSNGCAVWEPLSKFLDDAQYDPNQWWRIKDLFKQFYAYKAAAECFRYGGHCTSAGRLEAEVNLDHAKLLNDHIKDVIIPAIRAALNKA